MKALLFLCFGLVIGIAGVLGYQRFNTSFFTDPISETVKKVTEKPLEKYSFERLRQTEFTPSEIEIGEILKETPQYTSRMFYFHVGEYKTSGMLNTPSMPGSYPLLIMFRGFVPRESYTTGEGTRRSAEVYAQNGFITIAPDFLGYGESDIPTVSSVEDRFLTYVTAFTLFASVDKLNEALHASDSASVRVDTEKIGVWGHSNGGQIALSALAISGKEYPTVLWNPVTKPFPYSVLYFTDEFEDKGKALRKVIADFEKDYDIELYSTDNYLDWIKAPLQLHQGAEDAAVPLRWSNEFVQIMRDLEKEIEYFVYPGDDHNFARGSWGTVVNRNIQFFNKHFSREK